MKRIEFKKEYIKQDDSLTARNTVRSERDEQISRFFDKQSIMVRDKKTKELRLATKVDLALILRHCPTTDLHPFFKQCEEARSFSRYFWWSVKRKSPTFTTRRESL